MHIICLELVLVGGVVERENHEVQMAHLKSIKTDDTIPMGNITLRQDLFGFLRDKRKTQWGLNIPVGDVSEDRLNVGLLKTQRNSVRKHEERQIWFWEKTDLDDLVQYWGSWTGLCLHLQTSLHTLPQGKGTKTKYNSSICFSVKLSKISSQVILKNETHLSNLSSDSPRGLCMLMTGGIHGYCKKER